MDFENKINYLNEEFKETDILNIKSSNEFLYKIMNEVDSLISIYIKFDENKIRKKFIYYMNKNIESKEIKDKMKKNFKDIIKSFKSKKGGAAKDATNHLIPTVNEHINEGPLQNINNINEDPTIDINVTFLERLLKEANEERIQNAERQRRLAVQEEHSLTFLLFIFCILDWENRLNFSIIAFVCNLNINFNYSDRMTWDHRLMNKLWITYIKIILNMFVFFDLIWFIASVSHIYTFIDNRIVAMTPANTISYEYDIDYNSHLLALELISHYDVPNQDIINGYDVQLDNLNGPNNLVLDYFRSSDTEDQFGNINRAYNILGFNDFFTIAINRFQHLINQNNNNELIMNQESILNTIYYLSAISVYLLFYNILRLRERINRNNRNNRNGGSSLKKKSVKKKSVKKKSVKKRSVKKIR